MATNSFTILTLLVFLRTLTSLQQNGSLSTAGNEVLLMHLIACLFLEVLSIITGKEKKIFLF